MFGSFVSFVMDGTWRTTPNPSDRKNSNNNNNGEQIQKDAFFGERVLLFHLDRRRIPIKIISEEWAIECRGNERRPHKSGYFCNPQIYTLF